LKIVDHFSYAGPNGFESRFATLWNNIEDSVDCDNGVRDLRQGKENLEVRLVATWRAFSPSLINWSISRSLALDTL